MKIKTSNDGNGSMPRHIDEADLISYLDGELDASEQDATRVHLEGCWNCRSRLLSVQNSIENFLRVRKQVLPDEIPPANISLAQFRRRLAQHQNAPVSIHLGLRLGQWLRASFPSPFGRGLGRGRKYAVPPKSLTPSLSQSEREEVQRRLPLKLLLSSAKTSASSAVKVFREATNLSFAYKKTAFASALAVLIVAVLLFDPFKWNSVSADDLMLRASTYEFLNETASGKVIRTRSRIDRINVATKSETYLGQIETDADNLTWALHVSKQAVSGVTETATLRDRDKPTNVETFMRDFSPATAKYFSAQGWLPQVSVSLYQRLISGRGFKGNDAASATRHGPVYEIHHQFATSHPSQITETVLTLNRQTYAPETVSIFTVEGVEHFEYRLTRTSIESIERTPEVAKLFESPTDDSSKTVPSANELETRNSKLETGNAELGPRNSKLETAVASADLEVEVLRLIHEAGADLGEQVSVSRTAGGPVRVSGIVETDRRKNEILRALQPVANNPAVRIDVTTVAEAMAERRDKQDSSRATTVEGVEVAADTFPAYQDLRARMSDEEARVFAARMVSRSHSAMRHAWALKRLMSQFSASELATLQPEAHAKWIALIQSHAREFAQETAGLLQQLEPIFGAGSAGIPPAASTVSNDADLIRAVERIVALASTNYEVVRSAFTVTRESVRFTAIKSPQFWQSMKTAESIAQAIERAH